MPSLRSTIFILFSMFFVYTGCVQSLENISTSKEEYVSVETVPDCATSSSGPAKPGPEEEAFNDAPDHKIVQKPYSQKPDLTLVHKQSAYSPAANAGGGSESAEEEPPAHKIQLNLDEALDFCQTAQDFWNKGELENALSALDQAYSLIIDIDDQEAIPELCQQKDDLRFAISKRILEIYASRNIVVNGGHNEIPIILNDHVMAEVKLFTTGKEKDFFRESYRRSGWYRPRIVAALKEAGLPVELSWMPMIESGFKVNALSRARALGLWQFIPSTGYKFGLERDYYIDERLDFEKSTEAAVNYLKELHQIFGDWTTVLAAYNCGESKVLRIIRDQNINYLDNFWDLYERLPKETARYVPRFLATLHILKNLEKYGLDQHSPAPPLEYETVSISKPALLRDIAKKIGASEKTMKMINPELRYGILPPENYSLRIPVGKKDALLAVMDEVPTASKPRQAYLQHRIRRGETLSTIAKKYRTSVNAITQANGIYRQNHIVAGRSLKIPRKGTVVYKKTKHANQPKIHTTTHVVERGDSLWILAKRYGTTTEWIQRANNLRSTRLQIGQFLRIPHQSVGGSAQQTAAKTYRVRRGDSPFRIANRHNMELEDFLRLNRLDPRSKIYPGQFLQVE